MNKLFSLLSRSAGILAAFFIVSSLHARVEDAPAGVAGKIWARGTAYYDEENDNAYLQLIPTSGQFLASAPSAGRYFEDLMPTTNALYSGDTPMAQLKC